MGPRKVSWVTRPIRTSEEVTAVSDATGHFDDRRRRGYAPFGVQLPGLTRADLVLALIPLAFAVALLAAATLPLAVREALAIASAFGLGAILDGVVRNPPVPERAV
jgi:hypothetical protein